MSTTFVGITHTVREALAAQITDGGVSCLPYDTWTRMMGNVAALSANATREIAVYNGGAHLRSLRLGVLVYTIVAGDTKASLRLGEQAVEQVMTAIGSDTTLGHVASGVDTDGPAVVDLYRDENGQMLQVHEVPIVITLLPQSA